MRKLCGDSVGERTRVSPRMRARQRERERERERERTRMVSAVRARIYRKKDASREKAFMLGR